MIEVCRCWLQYEPTQKFLLRVAVAMILPPPGRIRYQLLKTLSVEGSDPAEEITAYESDEERKLFRSNYSGAATVYPAANGAPERRLPQRAP
jgi:hypothetical protein